MKTSYLLRAFVLLFSLTAGGLLTWQLTRNISGGSDVQSEEGDPGSELNQGTLAIGPKSPGGSLNMGELLTPEKPKAPDRPLMHGSKSGISLVIEEVDPAWELAVPPVNAPETEEKEE